MDAAELGGFTGDQSGMGQGLAYVLPQSRTVGYFMQLANEKAQERRNQAAALAKAQQDANDQYAQHLYQFKTPEIANEYTKWLQPKFDDLIGKGADYHAQTGQDPFTNPDFVRQTNDLNTVAKSTHQANVRAVALGTALADKSKNYTPESKQAATDWLQAYYKDPVKALYTPPPSLEQRNLGLNDALKLAHPVSNEVTQNGYNVTVPNRHGHVSQLSTILGEPEFAPYLQQNGINPTVGDAFGQPNGHGGTIYPTDTPTVNSIADHIIQNAQQPHFAATLQSANIDPADPHAKDKLVELVQKQNAGYGKVLGEGADKLDAMVNQKKVANLDIARQRLDLAKEKAAKNAPNPNAIEPQDVNQIPYATAQENGGFNLNVHNWVPVKSGSVAFSASPDIDATTGGKPQGLSPLSSFKIAGVGDIPQYKTSGGAIKAGTPISPQYENTPGLTKYKRMVILEGPDPNDKSQTRNYLMDYNKIPANVKNQKSFKEAISQFEATPVYGSDEHVQQQQTKSKKVTDVSSIFK
jgi:hypothetical protein